MRAARRRLIQTYEELDVSGGAPLAKRPGLSKAVAAIESGDAEVVVAEDFDRLFRRLTMQAEVVARVERAGGRVRAVDVGEITDDSAGQWLSATMLGAVSEYYRRSAIDRGNQTADAVAARGVHNRVPFGYRRNGTYVDRELAVKLDPSRDGKALVPDPETAPLVEHVFQMRADAQPWVLIGRWLEAQGAHPRSPRGSSGQWTVSTLRNMIANDVYLGVLTLGERCVEGAHEPLVTRSLWKAAQSRTSIQRTGKNAAGAAGGLLHCGCCGRVLSVTGTNPAYACRRQLDKVRCERPTYVSKTRADEFVERAVAEVLQHGSLDVLAPSRDIDRLRRELETARAELERFVVHKSALDAQVFKLGIDARQTAADGAREAYEDAVAAAESAAELPDVSGWAALDLDGRRRVARALIDKIVVSPPVSRGPHADVARRFEIRWNGAGQ